MRQGRSSSVGGRAGVVRAGGQGRTRSEGRGRMSIGLLAKMEVRVRGDVLARTGNLQRWKVKAGSTTSSSYVLADRKGLDDFPAPRPLTESLWSFELRFEEKYGLAGGFSGNLGAKESHSPSTPPGPSGTASLRLSPGGIPSCPVHWTFVRPVLSGCRRVPSTLSVLSTPNGHWAEPPGPGQSLWWTAVEACVANQCTANHPSLVYNCAASPTSRSSRLPCLLNPTGFLGATLRHLQEGERMQTVFAGKSQKQKPAVGCQESTSRWRADIGCRIGLDDMKCRVQRRDGCIRWETFTPPFPFPPP